ncbi:MAG: helix-turn-helix domain-containing protein [Oscillospiraceae bacterium]|nr:Helix-turn-helix [uncultured Ruminococcus sp.]
MNEKPNFGQFISEQRHKLSMESQELAKVIGILNAYLSQLEKGIRTYPSTGLLDKIANILCLNKTETFLNCFSIYFLRSAISGTEIFYTYTKFNK